MPDFRTSNDVLDDAGAAPARDAPAASCGDEPAIEAAPGRRHGIARGFLGAVVMGVAVAIAAWFLAGSGGAGADSSSGSARTGPRVGKEAPDFRVVQLDGTVARLSDFRGHPVWLSFWATWCPPCRAESGEIEAASRRYADAGLVVLAIDVGEDAGAVQSYVGKAGLTYLVGLDGNEQLSALYRVSGLPNHFFIDANGVLREWRVGPVDVETVDSSIAGILPAAVPLQAGAISARR